MGYYVSMELCNCVIPANRVPDAQAAVQALNEREGVTQYRYHEEAAFLGSREPIIKALWAWDYGVEDCPDGSIRLTHFEGEKWRSDERLFDVLAPFLVEGAEIYITGEDHDRWAYRVQGGQLLRGRCEELWHWDGDRELIHA